MKLFSRLICMLLIVSMMLVVPANAAVQGSDFFVSHSCYLWETSSTSFEVWFSVTAVDGMDMLGASEIRVQRSTDRSNWETVATYYDVYNYNTSSSSGHVTYSSVQPGYYYRARVTFFAENYSGTASYTDYTSYI